MISKNRNLPIFFIVLSGIVIMVLIATSVTPHGDPIRYDTEIVKHLAYQSANSSTLVGMDGNGGVMVGTASSAAKFEVITNKDVYLVEKAIFFNLSVGDEVQVASYKTLLGNIIKRIE